MSRGVQLIPSVLDAIEHTPFPTATHRAPLHATPYPFDVNGVIRVTRGQYAKSF